MEILIIGASFAGVSCALRARQLYPKAKITIIEKNQVVGFIPSGFLQYLTGQVARLEEAVFIKKEVLKKAGIEVNLGESLLRCFPEQHQIETSKKSYTYDRLVLAYGSIQESQVLQVEEFEGRMDVPVVYKDFPSAQRLATVIPEVQTIAIIGAGQAGMEAASAFVQMGKQVEVFETMDYPLFKYFDQSFLAPFLASLEQVKGLRLHCNTSVNQIRQTQTQSQIPKTVFEVQTHSLTQLSDLVFTMVNVRPKANPLNQVFESHSDYTIKTDAYLETSQADVFAVGDLIQIPALALKEKTYMPLINNAVRSGMAAAENLKQKTKVFKGGLRTIGTQLFGWYLASTGLLEAEAFNYPGKIATKSYQLSARLFSTEVIYCKVTFDETTHEVLGVQLLSKTNCLEKINTAALAIETKRTLEELAQKDYFFQPRYTPVFDILNHLGLGSDRDEV
ncbi:hypothetical protein IGI37_000565 [Enterococcus sp. AZ194]|uniref:FAD-dependent oxidoreductase n=1 Tax=Enterococcus sp. AZ194 TaxID=2774629 RepID=UPI003F2708B8